MGFDPYGSHGHTWNYKIFVLFIYKIIKSWWAWFPSKWRHPRIKTCPTWLIAENLLRKEMVWVQYIVILGLLRCYYMYKNCYKIKHVIESNKSNTPVYNFCTVGSILSSHLSLSNITFPFFISSKHYCHFVLGCMCSYNDDIFACLLYI